MYFAMDEIGLDNVSRLSLMEDKDNAWSEIARIAEGFGFEGVQFTSRVSKSFGDTQGKRHNHLGIEVRHASPEERKLLQIDAYR